MGFRYEEVLSQLHQTAIGIDTLLGVNRSIEKDFFALVYIKRLILPEMASKLCFLKNKKPLAKSYVFANGISYKIILL